MTISWTAAAASTACSAATATTCCSATRGPICSPAATGATPSRGLSADHGRDTIADFTPGVDFLALDGVLRNFDGSEAAVARYVRFAQASGSAGSLLQVDPDGAGSAAWRDLALLQGVSGLQARDLYLSGGLVIDARTPPAPQPPAPPPPEPPPPEPPAPPSLPPGFDGLQYIASYTDLIVAFGADRAAGTQHFLGFGQSEGRAADRFAETQYLKNYGDLQTAFATDVDAATRHFIQFGSSEGRNDAVGTPAQIDGLQYLASHADLIQAFGANAAAGQQHYVGHGQSEGRALDTFDETQYLANYADLRAAFGNDTEAATQHFLTNGFTEGRNDFLI